MSELAPIWLSEFKALSFFLKCYTADAQRPHFLFSFMLYFPIMCQEKVQRSSLCINVHLMHIHACMNVWVQRVTGQWGAEV